MIKPNADVDVTVVCPEEGMRTVLYKLREWHTQHRLGQETIKSIRSVKDLNEARQHIIEIDPHRSILIPIGYSEDEIRACIDNWGVNGIEVIVRPPRIGTARSIDADVIPSASLMEKEFFISIQDPIAALRKALVRRQVIRQFSIHGIASPDELTQFFRLRYQVWTAQRYLPNAWNDRDSEWEVHFSDRSGYPIGAFDQRGALIACARLVFPCGEEIKERVDIITNLLRDSGYPSLLRYFTPPERALHPFDLLDAFTGFREYYRKLIIDRIKHAEISRVIVRADYRNSGLGEVMVDTLKSIAKTDYSISTLLLACNERLQSFYQRCGFIALPGLTCERFADVDAPAIAMVCQPSPANMSEKQQKTVH